MSYPNLFCASLLFTLLALYPNCLPAQQINLSLHATAVPDSFEVRATATSGVFNYLPNATFTLRWELASGGVANNSDIQRPCGVFPVYNYGGTHDIGDYRYFTLNLFGERNMGALCSIDTAGTVLCGVRIREFSGCRHVALVQNAYTGMNNVDYYFSVGGSDVTGVITSDPIPGGDCSGCVPPMIQSVQVGALPECGSGPVDFSVVATGTDLDYSWRSPTGVWIGYGPQGSLANGIPGQYVVTVSNSCGTAMDTVTAGFNPDLCDPAVLDSVWFEVLPPNASQIRLHTEGTGSCLYYRWINPSGNISNRSTSVSMSMSAILGTYTFILLSPCGNDTLVRELTPEMLCVPPEISLVSSNAPAQMCNLNPFALHVEGSGTPAPVFEWTAPDGSSVVTGDSVWLDPPQDGLYMVRAISSCGVDSAFYPVQLDTAGLAGCVLPVIIGMTSDTVCGGDTAMVQVQVSTTGPCSTYQWGGANPSSTPILEVPVIAYSSSITMSFTVSNACGSSTSSYQLPIISQHVSNRYYCGADGPINLDSLYAEYLVVGGYWERDGQVVPSIYQSVPDSSAYFNYWEPDGCAILAVGIVDGGSHYAGEDAFIQICSDADPVDLVPLLGPGAEPDGYWYYETMGVIDGHYDPDWFWGTPTIVFRYIVGNNYCRDTAFVTVEETPGPFPWYADADGDGLGDYTDSLLSCDPVPGYITMAGDECPLVPGTIGSLCDDGLASTVNDTLNADCLCMGITTAVAEQGPAGNWLLWPNPARDQVFLQAPVSGPVSIAVVDAGGRVVQQLERTLGSTTHAQGGTASWSTAHLARGAYAVRIVSPQTVRVLRLVVE